MVDLKELTIKELGVLYFKTEKLREQVNELVNKYGYTSNDLTTRKLSHDIERVFGRKVLDDILDSVDNETKIEGDENGKPA